MYTARFVFEDGLGTQVRLVNSPEEVPANAPVVFYGSKASDQGIQIMPQGLLSQRDIADIDVAIGEWQDLPTLFPTSGTLPFDLFAAVFYLISRYEEYLPHRSDKHGRFDPCHSLAHQQGFLQRPLIDEWLVQFRQVLVKQYPDISLHERSFQHINTVDVDTAYAYIGKGTVRTVGAFIRSLLRADMNDLRARSQALLGRTKDPFDTFSMIIESQQKFGFSSIFFFLLGDYGVNDKNIPYTSLSFQSLIKHVNDYCEVGIHPSYASTVEPGRIKVELERLQQIVHQPIRKSRQHFLKIRLPDSYRHLLQCEVTDDYSMAYASEPGFRASTSLPFYWYDLEQEEISPLRVHSFALMEATFKYYHHLSPETALERMKPIIDRVRNVNGVLYTTWHNDTLSEHGDWKGWQSLYHRVLAYIHQG